MSVVDTLLSYGLKEIGGIELTESTFKIVLSDDKAGKWQKAIYAFVIGDEVMRIGSSKGMLLRRIRQWNRDVTNALKGNTNATRSQEANAWKVCLQAHSVGRVFGRVATLVTTPIGTFEAYMDEESVLINRFKPPLNNHTNR